MLCSPPPSRGPPFAALVCISLSLAASAFCLACRRVHSAIGSVVVGGGGGGGGACVGNKKGQCLSLPDLGTGSRKKDRSYLELCCAQGEHSGGQYSFSDFALLSGGCASRRNGTHGRVVLVDFLVLLLRGLERLELACQCRTERVISDLFAACTHLKRRDRCRSLSDRDRDR